MSGLHRCVAVGHDHATIASLRRAGAVEPPDAGVLLWQGLMPSAQPVPGSMLLHMPTRPG